MEKLIKLLKKIPIDFGQESVKYHTKGKQIARTLLNEKGKGKHALDVGCRDGYFTKYLCKLGYKTTSIDVECKFEKCSQIDANNPMPYPDNSFDLIWCSEVIEHLEDPKKTLNEFKRIMKQDGMAVLTTPNSHFWLYFILKLFRLSPKKVQNPTHIHFFNIKDILNFEPDRGIVYGFFPYLLARFRIRKLVGFLSPTFVFVIKKNSHVDR